MVDNYLPHLDGDPVEACTQCWSLVSAYHMFEHEKWHEEKATTKAFIEALMKQRNPFLENPPSNITPTIKEQYYG